MKNRTFKLCVMVCGLLCSTLSQASEQLLTKFFDEVITLRAQFNQQVVDETGYVLETSSGVFYLSRPGQFRWDYKSEDPNYELGQQIVADGDSIFMYDPDLQQVTKRSLKDALAQIPSLLLVQTGQNIDVHFNVSDFGLIDGLSWVGLKPKDENASYQQLMIGFLGEEINTITLLDGLGNETQLSLTVVRENVDLDNNTFAFVPPDGADVLAE